MRELQMEHGCVRAAAGPARSKATSLCPAGWVAHPFPPAHGPHASSAVSHHQQGTQARQGPPHRTLDTHAGHHHWPSSLSLSQAPSLAPPPACAPAAPPLEPCPLGACPLGACSLDARPWAPAPASRLPAARLPAPLSASASASPAPSPSLLLLAGGSSMYGCTHSWWYARQHVGQSHRQMSLACGHGGTGGREAGRWGEQRHGRLRPVRPGAAAVWCLGWVLKRPHAC